MLLGAAVGAGREDLDHADPVGRRAGRSARIGREARVVARSGGRHRCVRSPDEDALDRLVDGAPLVLVGLVAAQEVDARHARARARAARSARPSARRATARARPDRRRRCSRGSRPAVSKWMPAAIRRSPTVRNASRSGPSAPNSSNSRRTNTPALLAAGRSREQAAAPQRRWWRSMKASRSASGSVESIEPDLAGGLGPADLAPDLVALLLAERAEVVVEVGARGQRRRPGRRPRARRSASSPRPSRAARTPSRARPRPGPRSAGGAGRPRPTAPDGRVAVAVRQVVDERRPRRPAGRRARASSVA